ncbi:MAG TPA: hypothetical protein VKI99_14260, partial [Candidatus Dormibacteraeota bacterium]|nr:hypothetical protein [Candidatus Dormibacteraeota bacterium]
RGQVLRPWAHGTFTRSAAALARRGSAHAGPNGDGTAGRRRGALSQANGQGADRELPGAGEIWICKLGWWDQAPWDVRAYAEGHSTYPCDSTLQQLYDGAEFEAYHELGSSAVRAAAAAEGGLPLPIPLADCRQGAPALARRDPR